MAPCSNCSRTGTACVYRDPPPSQRHKRRLTTGNLLSKIQELETLLASKDIPFEPLNNNWITSSWEGKFVQSSHPEVQTSSSSSDDTRTIAVEQIALEQETQVPIGDSAIVPGQQSEAAKLWSGLSEDVRSSFHDLRTGLKMVTKLRNPSVSQLKRFGKDNEEELSRPENTFQAPSLFLPDDLTIGPVLLELHPEPKYVFMLWQSFVENVNPLTKIVHIPTLQAKVFCAASNVALAPKPLQATMFAVYALAVTSMRAADCTRVLGESRSVLLSRFRTGALRALSATNILSTNDLEVLQALALILVRRAKYDQRGHRHTDTGR